MTPRPFAFPRRLRLRGETTFRNVFREGARARGSVLQVIARGNDLPESRLGISVARRVTRSSPERNRLKRLVREAFRLNRRRLPTGLDLVVCPLVPGPAFTLAAVAAELERLSRQAGARVARSRSLGPTGGRPSA
ncbi:MAG TPA: ribonuclease P protein component [Planctomycetota bacterium]|nr:ribonuclease P protein component [Planctomycetota bacterium]